jgi:hypothetical protein
MMKQERHATEDSYFHNVGNVFIPIHDVQK